jgi:hypothetical protein
MALLPICLSFLLVGCQSQTGKAILTILAMIRGRKELPDHIFARLTHIIAHFRRYAAIFSRIDRLFSSPKNVARFRVNLEPGQSYALERLELTHPFKLNDLANFSVRDGEVMVFPTRHLQMRKSTLPLCSPECQRGEGRKEGTTYEHT